MCVHMYVRKVISNPNLLPRYLLCLLSFHVISPFFLVETHTPQRNTFSDMLHCTICLKYVSCYTITL